MKPETFFTSLENTSPQLKLAIQGSAGSGKTYTITKIAIGLHKRIKSTKPIVIFDTEQAAKFLIPLFKEAGIEVLLKQSRQLADFAEALEYASSGNANIFIADSVTHLYENVIESRKKAKESDSRIKYKEIEFSDWGKIKPYWKREFSDRVVRANCHVLFAGREGFVYEQQVNEDTHRKEIVKVGVKMKAEGETAYEPDVLVRAERFEELLDKDNKKVWREFTIIKDRSAKLDGKTFVNLSYKDIEPVVDFLLDNPTTPRETQSFSDSDALTDQHVSDESRKDRQIEIARATALLDKVSAGTGKDAKALRVSLVQYAFYGEVAEEALEGYTVEQLREGLSRLSAIVEVVGRIPGAESYVYGVDKAITNARLKYLETANLGEAPIDKLQSYFEHMKEKAKAKREKAEEPTGEAA